MPTRRFVATLVVLGACLTTATQAALDIGEGADVVVLLHGIGGGSGGELPVRR